jgi:hypothetical protein
VTFKVAYGSAYSTVKATGPGEVAAPVGDTFKACKRLNYKIKYHFFKEHLHVTDEFRSTMVFWESGMRKLDVENTGEHGRTRENTGEHGRTRENTGEHGRTRNSEVSSSYHAAFADGGTCVSDTHVPSCSTNSFLPWINSMVLRSCCVFGSFLCECTQIDSSFL